MALSSESTLEEVRAAYLDNAAYEETGNVAMARAFVSACRMLLILPPKRSMADGGETELDLGLVQREMKAAQRFVTGAVETDEGHPWHPLLAEPDVSMRDHGDETIPKWPHKYGKPHLIPRVLPSQSPDEHDRLKGLEQGNSRHKQNLANVH